jgi:hypothetical protein
VSRSILKAGRPLVRNSPMMNMAMVMKSTVAGRPASVFSPSWVPSSAGGPAARGPAAGSGRSPSQICKVIAVLGRRGFTVCPSGAEGLSNEVAAEIVLARPPALPGRESTGDCREGTRMRVMAVGTPIGRCRPITRLGSGVVLSKPRVQGPGSIEAPERVRDTSAGPILSCRTGIDGVPDQVARYEAGYVVGSITLYGIAAFKGKPRAVMPYASQHQMLNQINPGYIHINCPIDSSTGGYTWL